MPGESLTLCYADFKTMDMLIKEDKQWESVFDNSLKVVKEGYLGDSFPCYATSFNYKSKIYDTKKINTIQTLITAIHLAEIGQCPQQTIDFVKEKVKNRNLYGGYLKTGEPTDQINSTAVYALAAILVFG